MKGQKVTNVRTTADDKKVNWTKIRRIPFTKGSPDMYFVKYNYGKEFQCIKLTMINRDVVLTKMSQMKCQDGAHLHKKDLVDFCKAGMVFPDFHDFDKSIVS